MPKKYSFETLPYKIRYAVLDPNMIYNYPKKTLPYTSEKKERYDRIEASILEEGFLNPILIITGLDAFTWIKRDKLPEEILNNPTDAIICPRHGGTRLYFATKHNLPIPCIISDFMNRFPDEKTVESFEELTGYFQTKLRKCQLTVTGVYIEGLN